VEAKEFLEGLMDAMEDLLVLEANPL